MDFCTSAQCPQVEFLHKIHAINKNSYSSSMYQPLSKWISI